MLFGNKNPEKRKCENCGSKSEMKYSFCPHCGNSFIDPKKEKMDYGMLGRDDEIENSLGMENLGFMDKMVSSMFNSLMKNLDKQMQKEMKNMQRDPRTEIKTFPNGVKIKISGPFQQQPRMVKKKITIDPEKLKKMSSMPREKAKTSVKRLSDKIVYELATPGVASLQDIFISKLESGYEIKAVGENKVYVNSIPINLPIKAYSIIDNKLSVEFHSGHPPQDFF